LNIIKLLIRENVKTEFRELVRLVCLRIYKKKPKVTEMKKSIIAISIALLSTTAIAQNIVTVTPSQSTNESAADSTLLRAMFSTVSQSGAVAERKMYDDMDSDVGTSTTTYYGPGNVPIATKTTTINGKAQATIGVSSASGMTAATAAPTQIPFGTSVYVQGVSTPASIACMYGYTKFVSNCNPQQVTANVTPNAKAKAIAVVDAYGYPNALTDLQAFSTAFNLPAPKLNVIYATGKQPAPSPNNWEVETALDLQWTHAMAPSAKLILVQAASSSSPDMLFAIAAATKAVQAAGGGVVSMSFGGGDFASTQYDSYFNNAGVIYYAASGDHDLPQWPCTSSYVVCVGGTSIRQTGVASTGHAIGDFEQEVAWAYAGSGASQFVPKPAYQANVVPGNFRGVPDIALASDNSFGAWVYYTPAGTAAGNASWIQVSGTSWATPMAAGITANSSTTSTTSVQELTKLYSGKSNYFTDITGGYCGNMYGFSSATGWDNCTGLGSFFNYK
jgi:subtilase family serine protease